MDSLEFDKGKSRTVVNCDESDINMGSDSLV